MASRFSLAILAACLMAAPDVAVAQVAAGDVTLKVPLNLTKLSGAIDKVRIECVLVSTALNSTQLDPHKIAVTTEVPATNGQVVTTATVVFSNFTLTNPAGVTAISECSILAHNRNEPANSWWSLDGTSPLPEYRLTPALNKQRTTFTW